MPASQGGAVPQGFKAADGSPCPERRILMNGGQSGNAFPACQCICNTQSPDALFAPPPCLRYIRQSIFAKQPETHYAGNDKAAVQKLKRKTEIPRLHPHLLRHTFATRYLENGGDIYSLREILGHTSLTMVQKYLHLTQQKTTQRFPNFSPMGRISRKTA